MPSRRAVTGRRPPVSLWAGAVLIGACQLLLFTVDLPLRQWKTIPLDSGEPLPVPHGVAQTVARHVAVNMTPLCWVGYLLCIDGLLTLRAGRRGHPHLSSIRVRPSRCLTVWLLSIPLWCYFDWVNFYYLDAWRYHGLPKHLASRFAGYIVAFAAIGPGMFLAAQWLNHLGLVRLRSKPVRIGFGLQVAVFGLGIVFVTYPFVVAQPIGNLTLWLSLMFLLDPVNHWLGEPSVIGDWRKGRWGRTVSLMAAGALCGGCWEFWNYWALAKWTYRLPFLGAAESYRYFEMPWIGFQGFLPFAIECWVVTNTMLAVLKRFGLAVAEPLPSAGAVL